jgi:hypothetical protein
MIADASSGSTWAERCAAGTIVGQLYFAKRVSVCTLWPTWGSLTVFMGSGLREGSVTCSVGLPDNVALLQHTSMSVALNFSRVQIQQPKRYSIAIDYASTKCG